MVGVAIVGVATLATSVLAESMPSRMYVPLRYDLSLGSPELPAEEIEETWDPQHRASCVALDTQLSIYLPICLRRGPTV